MVFSRTNYPILTRLFGGVTLAVFLAWFVLPSCHCQWGALFGDSPEQTGIADLLVGSADTTSPDQPCHCDDCPGKTFEPADEAHLRTGLHAPASLEASILSYGIGAFPTDVLTRGPPPEFSCAHHSEPRTYLRQLSFRL